ncbi:MAG: FIST N-terminal domain-containing protein [Campylobacterota bacterium]|nr:FIST N-terminal domain-containing protein [Campylobacterota bacterium]
MITVNTEYNSIDDIKKIIAKNDIDTNSKLLIQIFTGILDIKFIEQLIQDIKTTLPNSEIIGSTTDGEIINSEVSTNKTIISISKFEKVTFKIDYIEFEENKTTEQSANLLANKICQKDTKAIITFADGLNTNGEEFLNGLSCYDDSISISGGLAGDNATFTKTFVFTNDKIISAGAVAVSLNGDINISTNYSFHWEPIGKELVITKSENNVVYTIDGNSAYDTYKYYLGEEVANMLPAIGIEFPLIIQRNGIAVARAAVGLNDDGSLVFAGNLHEGDVVQFGYGNSEQILNNSNKKAMSLNDVPIESIFVYSCMARRRFMPALIQREIEPLTNFGTVSGFFTYGEFFTTCCSKNKELLNQTMTLITLSESDTNQNAQVDKLNSYEDDTSTITTKALSYLVNVTSKELQKINEDLKVSVHREKQIVKDQEKHLFAQAKMASMGEMIGNIAHQWRQPLSTISTITTGAQVQNDLGILDAESFKTNTDKIIENVTYLSDTINIFRDFLKDDKELKEYNLQDTIKQVLVIVGAGLKDNHIVLEQIIDYDTPIPIKMVSGELSQVIINIINNAKDAILENEIKNGIVKLNCYRKENIAYIEIVDNAGGIPEHVLPKIFDPYFTTKDRSNGTGLGLHMSYDIITKHMNGKIIAKNHSTTNEDGTISNGATFYLELPL